MLLCERTEIFLTNFQNTHFYFLKNALILETYFTQFFTWMTRCGAKKKWWDQVRINKKLHIC